MFDHRTEEDLIRCSPAEPPERSSLVQDIAQELAEERIAARVSWCYACGTEHSRVDGCAR